MASSSPRSIRSQSGSATARRQRPHPHRTRSPLTSQRGMYPFTSAEGREESRDSMGVARATRPGSSGLPHLWGTCLACYRAGTELLTVEAEACVAVFGRAHGERRASGVRRAAPLWWFLPDERVSAPSRERCQLQRASRAASDRQKFPSRKFLKRASPKRARRLQRTPPPPLPHQACPRLLGIEECPHYAT